MADHTPSSWGVESADDEINISMLVTGSAEISDSSSVAARGRDTEVPPAAWEEQTDIPNAIQGLTLDSVSNKSDDLDLEFGEVPLIISAFAPFKLVRQYPYIYVGKANQKRVAEFFGETLLNYGWDLFSQYYPSKDPRDPLLLVSTSQFDQYLDMVNHALGTALALPRGRGGGRYSITFGEWGTPRPRFIGRAESTSAFDEVKARACTLSLDDLSHLSPGQHQIYCDKMELIFNSLKSAKRKKDPEASKAKRIERQKDCGRMVKRVQRYLGLRQAMSHVASNNLETQKWDVSKPAPFKAREHTRFVCVDIEAYEKNANIVTEIGLAVLDTEDLIDIAPGKGGENWLSRIQAHHIRIAERSYMVNSEYVQGCPEAFNFGESQMVSLNDVNKAVREIIDEDGSEDQIPVIIVGHDLGHDLNYLTKIGYNPWTAPQIIDEMDTKAMFQRFEQSPNGRGLGTVCAELGIHGYNYHNAGNDAVYTLQAMIAMAIKRMVEGSGKKEDSPVSNIEEWTDGDMDDGGCAKRSAPPVPKKRVLGNW